LGERDSRIKEYQDAAAEREALFQARTKRLADGLTGDGKIIGGGSRFIRAARLWLFGERHSRADHFAQKGDLARDKNDWSTATALYRKALRLNPALMPIWVQLGHGLKESGDYRAAEEAYLNALTLDDRVADTHLQLGHLMNLQARRAEALRAYAAASRLAPDLVDARESLHALTGYSSLEAERLVRDHGGGWYHLENGEKPAPPPRLQEQRYGLLLSAAARRSDTHRDVIWLGVIDWHFRIQRPQHLCRCLAAEGARVFYISIVFDTVENEERFRIVENPCPGVFVVRLHLDMSRAENIYNGLTDAGVGDLQAALDALTSEFAIREPLVVLNHPAWHQVAFSVTGATIVYDCLDLASGFSNAAPGLAEMENSLFANADLVVSASRPLAELIAPLRSTTVIRNACETERFATAFSDSAVGERPVIGYFGAIAEWFNIDWIEACAAAHPSWQFRLIGRTSGCDISRAEKLSNVTFCGECRYEELPGHLRDFDVAVIPFKMTDLIRCTNPVKLYEYMMAGKPVVAAPMPEVLEATDLVYIAADALSFGERIAQALAEDTIELRQRRQAWASRHDWSARAEQFYSAVVAMDPLVSIVILTHNNWRFSNACLNSVIRYSDYPNFEIIVVDNASTDGIPENLQKLQRQEPRLRLILNENNVGFAAGNNVGIKATGEYIILLNNDTYVTYGWIRGLIRPMQLNSEIGLVGPLTNNIGNEQKIRITYHDMQEMEVAARRFVRSRLRQMTPVRRLAFFAVALRRRAIDLVGLLDERYGLGYFEDDDYCMRANEQGVKMVIADDVFVHHHLSVSFSTLGAQAGELMKKNRALFEERWGAWEPHRYRDEPGFG
jgi:hypothetical protein